MARTTVTEIRQGAYRIENSPTGLVNPESGEPTTFVPQQEGTLRANHQRLEQLLELADWENDPMSWTDPTEVPSLATDIYMPPDMEEQYDHLFNAIPQGHLEPPKDGETTYTIIDWTQSLLSAHRMPMSPAFIRYCKARWVTFLNMEYPERDEDQLDFRWFQGKDRTTQEQHLAEQFGMIRQVFDWMIEQGMRPLQASEQVLPDLLEVTIDQQMAKYRRHGIITDEDQTAAQNQSQVAAQS